MAVLVKSAGGGQYKITNGKVENYMAASGTIAKYTFVTITNGLISTATSTISGLTISEATTTKAGKVIVYGG